MAKRLEVGGDLVRTISHEGRWSSGWDASHLRRWLYRRLLIDLKASLLSHVVPNDDRVSFSINSAML